MWSRLRSPTSGRRVSQPPAGIPGKTAPGAGPAKGAGACFLLVFCVLSCARDVPPPPQPTGYPKPYRVFGSWYQPIPDATGFRQEGIASWYGADFHGRKTSNGEIYDMYAMTAAHKTLPMGTLVRVRNLANQREIDVRINDRGPFVRGRIIDLSYTAARKIDIVGPGTAPVAVTALGAAGLPPTASMPSMPVDYFYTGNFSIQIGAFSNRHNAERLKRSLDQEYEHVQILSFDKGEETFYRVRIGRFTDLTKAEAQEQHLIGRGFSDAFVIAE